MGKSPEEMAAAMVRNLKEKTGKTLAQWLKIANGSKFTKHGELIKFLKSDHGMSHGYANLIAHETLQAKSGGPSSDTQLIDQQYAGGKAQLRPIFDALIGAVEKLGTDVVISPKKTYVSLRRNKQFALIQPSTKTRVDVGINLKDTAPTSRLEASGSFNSMVSHRVRITDKSEVDKEIISWLKAAHKSA